MSEPRCNRCCRIIRTGEVMAYTPFATDRLGGTEEEYICKKCWNDMTPKEKLEEDDNNWISPHIITIY